MTDVTIEVTETPIEVDVSVTTTPIVVSVSPTSTPVEVSISAVSTPVSVAISAASTPIEVDVTVNEAISNHDELDNLAYVDAGHTGFQPAGSYLTDAPSDGSTYGRKNAAWAVVTGITDHSLLSNLDYASAGHTGFQASLIADADYLTPGTAATTYLKLIPQANVTGPLVHQNASNSTSAFRINQADGTVVGNWDTTNKRFGILTDSPAVTFQVIGASRFGTAARYFQFSGGDFTVVGGDMNFRTTGNYNLHLGTKNQSRISIGNNWGVSITTSYGYDTTAAFEIVGDRDTEQLVVKANATQTDATVQHQTSNADVHNEFFVPHASNLYTTVLNKQGSPLLDFVVKSDAYDALFVDASNDSIDIMHNTGGKVGFYATAPTVQQVLATGAGATVDNVITALQTLGLVKQA